MNKMWMRFLFQLGAWACRRLENALLREKLRRLKRELDLENMRKN